MHENEEQWVVETKEHIKMVGETCNKFAALIHSRGESHDASKLEVPESPIFKQYTPKLKNCTYGSEEYNEFLKEMKVALDHHYLSNRHHPEWSVFNHIIELEEWRAVEGYEGIYSVSNWGRVKNTKDNKLMKFNKTLSGYYRIQLQVKGKSKNFLIHRLVATAFLPNRENKEQVNHKNTITTDNYVNNLEWVNNSENQIHAYNNGLQEIKYITYCEELNLFTFGIGEMERELKALGYDKARQSTILACINGKCTHHLGLHFIGYIIEDYSPPTKSLISGMSLLDLLEMFIDWYCASKRHANGDIRASIELNKVRFNIPDDIVQILINTIEVVDK